MFNVHEVQKSQMQYHHSTLHKVPFKTTPCSFSHIEPARRSVARRLALPSAQYVSPVQLSICHEHVSETDATMNVKLRSDSQLNKKPGRWKRTSQGHWLPLAWQIAAKGGFKLAEKWARGADERKEGLKKKVKDGPVCVIDSNSVELAVGKSSCWLMNLFPRPADAQ